MLKVNRVYPLFKYSEEALQCFLCHSAHKPTNQQTHERENTKALVVVNNRLQSEQHLSSLEYFIVKSFPAY